MQPFISAHGARITSMVNNLGVIDQQEVYRFLTICAFLNNSPESLSWRRRVRPDLGLMTGLEPLAEKFFTDRYKKDWPSEPTTVPDEAVSVVMCEVYGYSVEEAEQIKQKHQHAMSAENTVGALLERYIASVMEPHGWVWCAGDFVRATDFIRYDAVHGQWQVLQVKNRDNSENSSSSAIRLNTSIEKWFRTYSRTGRDNWHNFPDPVSRMYLSEQGFSQFIKAYLSQNRP